MDTPEFQTRESNKLLIEATAAAEALLRKADVASETLLKKATEVSGILRYDTAEKVHTDSLEAADVILRAASKASKALYAESSEAAQLLLRTASERADIAEAVENVSASIAEAVESARELLSAAAENAKIVIAEAVVKAVKLISDAALDAERVRRDAVKVFSVGLRSKAEGALLEITSEADAAMMAMGSKRLVHELQVQNLELEMQNLELQDSSQEVKKLQEYFSDFYDSSPTGFVSIDRNGAIIHNNVTFAQLLGRERSKLARNIFASFVAMDDRPVFNNFLQQLFERGTKQTCMLSLSDRDQTRIFVQIIGTLSPDKQYCRAVIVDQTERKQAEGELLKSEKRFRQLVENAPDAIFVRDKSCFTFLNNAAIWLFGAGSALELIGTPIIERYHPKVRDDIRKRMQIINEHHQKVPLYQSICLKLDGTEVHVESSAVPISSEGEDCALVFLRDITDRLEDQKLHQQLEEQLHQSQKIESIGELAGGVAHDYNNMLSVIIGNVELAQMKAARSAPVEENLSQILDAALRSRDITRQLLAFARKQIFNPKVIDLNASIESMLKMLRNLLGENIDLAWLPKSDLWLIKIDPSQLDQILANLCVNARDAIVDVGKMTIETNTVNFDQDYCNDHQGFVPGDYVMIAVSDSGCGMDKETLDNIFEPFFTTKKVGEGTGLGLATVYGIVKQSNGFINAYSEPDKGTTFRIYLPRCEEEGLVDQEATASEIQKGQGETVLLVEDEAAIITLATAMLEDLGYKVLAANSPIEALNVAEAHQGEIQLLLTDVVMPGMNGRDLAKQVQGVYPNTKTIYMSGYTANVIAHHGVLDEGINFIQKPFSRSDLSIRVRETLDTKA